MVCGEWRAENLLEKLQKKKRKNSFTDLKSYSTTGKEKSTTAKKN